MSGTGHEGGVRDQGGALAAAVRHLGPTLDLPQGARVLAAFGHYASVLELRADLALAVCTDGVGTKTIVASMLDRYDTIGFDCVAMNVNDVICVGARPLAMVDYLGVHTLDERRADAILAGLGAAAREAGIAIPGGEVAQLPEVIGSDGTVAGDERAFDLVGTCVGALHPRELITGDAIAPGDALVGLASSGLHSNGFTLARRALLGRGGLGLGDHIAELGGPLGEALLTPTLIYARVVRAMRDGDVELRGVAHITGDGLVNLCRLSDSVGFVIEELPERAPIFDLVQAAGGIGEDEMFRVFNMGIGLVVVVPSEQAADAIGIATGHGHRAERIGRVSDDAGRVLIEPASLVGALVHGSGRLVPA